jgi:hypothetical protein
MRRSSLLGDAPGFTLVEVLIASALFITLSLGVAQLFAVATTAGLAARHQTSATILAGAKMEQLRALTWSWETGPPGTLPLPRSDLTTNLSTEAPQDDGRGLRESPPATLQRNVPPYVDYLDGAGRWVGNGSSPPLDAVFVRRWAVRAFPADPDRTLILQVLVTTTREEASRGSGPWTRRTGQQALLTMLRTRMGL